MSYSVKKTTITLTRGDTFRAQISLTDENGDPYVFAEGDKVRFAMKKTYDDPQPIIVKDIPTGTMILELLSADTKDLEVGEYVYDMQLTTSAGDIYTFITTAKLKLTEEVY